MIYLDSSALVKLVVLEAETAALGQWLAARATPVVTCALARTEVPRAVRPHGAEAIAAARGLLSRLRIIAMDDRLLDAAGVIGPPGLRSLDAVHLCAAQALDRALDWFVAYDERLLAAAEGAAMPTISPGVI
ncbi:type II toxin-antitoxin system VapC family toxin [Sphaerimonospora mesophila]|uniref:type II toxin-antitoxin system VapC family toxin n=1 Tax=Sphaerimonospora mesophila TaxID=37483 RepID=UPI0006E15D67